ncbi:hypothetical protein LPB303_15820 [Polaribacter atrinae]|uniref:Uncharacterized protein n=1 Tax=Polaribacter atrinae TaxID=1333662 RepID=A0A176SYI2_9FLAO|nr:hypothetical protein LPB303_15820 [Polaribacter atrinae]
MYIIFEYKKQKSKKNEIIFQFILFLLNIGLTDVYINNFNLNSKKKKLTTLKNNFLLIKKGKPIE